MTEVLDRIAWRSDASGMPTAEFDIRWPVSLPEAGFLHPCAPDDIAFGPASDGHRETLFTASTGRRASTKAEGNIQ